MPTSSPKEFGPKSEIRLQKKMPPLTQKKFGDHILKIEGFIFFKADLLNRVGP